MWYLIGMGVSFFLFMLYLNIYISKHNIKEQYKLNDEETVAFYVIAVLVMAVLSSMWPLIAISVLSFYTFLAIKKIEKNKGEQK